jgi:Leucine-rich repeat (LRR) protein
LSSLACNMTEIDRLGENLSRIEDFKFNEIDQLQLCSYLNLHCNRLQHLQGLPYDRLCNLRELNLSSNDISLISLSELSFLPSLKVLDLSANKIQSVLDLPFLPGLDHLLVSYNMIESLIGLDENVPNLMKLDVSSKW